MSYLRLLQNATACAPNVPVPFSAVSGTSPYTYAILNDGAGGTINSAGLYTAPTGYGIDTIQVTDSAGLKATATILVGSPLQLVCDIIQNQMGLARGQVYLWDQKLNLPTDSKLYVAVGELACKAFSNTNDVSSGTTSAQSTNFSATLTIDILSRGTQARDRKEEVIMSLNSTYAESQMELNSFRVFPLPTNFVNLSQLDGAAIPYRFQISVALQYFVTKVVPLNYYSTFNENPSLVVNS